MVFLHVVWSSFTSCRVREGTENLQERNFFKEASQGHSDRMLDGHQRLHERVKEAFDRGDFDGSLELCAQLRQGQHNVSDAAVWIARAAELSTTPNAAIAAEGSRLRNPLQRAPILPEDPEAVLSQAEPTHSPAGPPQWW